MEIRLLVSDDVSAYIPVRLRALKEEPESFGEDFNEASQRSAQGYSDRLGDGQESFVLGAFVEGELVGTIGMFRKQGAKVVHHGVVWGMYVVPEHRGRGIARQLVAAAIARARTIRGLEQLCLSVVTSKQAAMQLYLGLGFVPYGVEPRALKVDGRFLDEAHMTLAL